MAEDRLVVNEIYGPVFQGEGPNTGRLCGFLRLGRCNLQCKWCDTAYTWDWKGINGIAYDPAKELSKMTLDEVVQQLVEFDLPLWVISGGEPMLQQKALGEIIQALRLDCFFEIETAGTLMPTEPWTKWSNVHFNVSPKLESSGNRKELRYKPHVLGTFAHSRNAAFKFVITSESDFAEVDQIVNDVGISISNVWCMPEGTSASTLLTRAKRIEEEVLRRGWNMTLRQHVLIHGNERGT